MQVKSPCGEFRFLVHRTLPKEMAWFSPKSPHVGTFTAANQPMFPRSDMYSTDLKSRRPCGMWKRIVDTVCYSKV